MVGFSLDSDTFAFLVTAFSGSGGGGGRGLAKRVNGGITTGNPKKPLPGQYRNVFWLKYLFIL